MIKDSFFSSLLSKRHLLLAIGFSFVFAFFLFAQSMIAGGVTVTVSDGSGTADAGSGGDTELTLSWTSSGFYTSGTEMTITISPTTSSTISDCSSASTAFGGSTGSFGSFTSSTATFTLTQNVSTSTSGSLCLNFGLTTSTATNYSITMRASSSTSEFTTTDFGAVLYYVLGANEVQVTASVPAALSFSIRNSADTANTNVCALGTLSLTDVNYCEYRLRVSTNAGNGFTATIQPSGDMTAGSATLTAITNDGSFATGTEAYGIAQLVGATTGGRSGIEYNQPVSEASATNDSSLTFNADATPLDFTSATTIISYLGPFDAGASPNTDTTTLVRHGAAISVDTETGSYSQTVTYRVTGSF